MCMIAEREPYTLPHFGKRHRMFMEPNNPFRSSARLMADYLCKGKIFFEHPNFVVYEGRLVSRGSGGLVNEEKEGAHRCFYGQSEMEFGDIPFSRSSDSGNSTCIFTGAAHIKNGWVAQSKKLRVVKIINFGLDSAAKDEGSQSSFGITYLGDDMGTQEASTSLLETSDNGSSGSVSHSRLKNVMFNGPLFRSHRRNAEIERDAFKPDQIQGKSSFIQHERENIQFNESLGGKQHDLGKQKLLELPGSRLNNTIETGSSNGKSIFLSDDVSDTYTCPIKNGDEATSTAELRESLSRIYDEVFVVENIPAAKEIVKMLTTKHKNHIYACDTEVRKIDVKKETPVDHGEVKCFSIYSGEGVDFGNGKSCIWVDVLDGGGRDIMVEFAPFFEDPSIKKKFMGLHKIGNEIETEMFTASGRPSVGGDVLKALAGKVTSEFEEDIDASQYGTAYKAFGEGNHGREACHAIAALCEVRSIDSMISNFILPLQSSSISGKDGHIHCSLNINTETGRLSARRPNLQNQPALEKDIYKIRQAFIAADNNYLIIADYGQLELRILAHLSNCKSMLDALKNGGDFHSRITINMYPHIRSAVEQKEVLLEWYPHPCESKPPQQVLKEKKGQNAQLSIAYGKSSQGLVKDWKATVREASEIVNLWYTQRQRVSAWQDECKKEVRTKGCVKTLLGLARRFPSVASADIGAKRHIERAAINTPVQGSAADVVMCAMLEITKNARLKELGWRLLLQVHDEVILEGPMASADEAKSIVVTNPFDGKKFLMWI
ncbi:hypothetical protein MKX01_016664 [Papaver californicum]|nr:hypothetical protein MKX01_016664 [Papaver californicum]